VEERKIIINSLMHCSKMLFQRPGREEKKNKSSLGGETSSRSWKREENKKTSDLMNPLFQKVGEILR
jgi:hypothetical protein